LIKLPETRYYKAKFYLLFFKKTCDNYNDHIDLSVSFGREKVDEQSISFNVGHFQEDLCKQWNQVEFLFRADQTDLYVSI
jgi:hypothetical protein